MYTKYYLVKGDDFFRLICADPSRLHDFEYLEFVEIMGEELAYMAYQYLKADVGVGLKEFIWQEFKHKIMRRK